MRYFRKILIANRGEIALRVMRTCRAMGIASVAVYSDADADSPHVRYADEAVLVGPPPTKESYLRIDRIIESALRTGAEAIHPGYGFLAENADFAVACNDAGITFIGPPSEAIRQMGLKSAARKIMADAGVPVVPGYDGADQELETLRRAALDIGLPVLIKASAGGGGKGMRVVRETAEIESAIESARREAEKSFGDGALLIEKFIARARHVEFQIFGDHQGNLVHLFERDCSIQRRHQKIIEESPSPALTAELRRSMGEAAVAAGRAIGYANAGTVEFILSPAGEFYFIEVNTRLQVEHPVTEMITGLDLVRLQIEVAEGKPLPFAQEDIEASGHAIEARLYAEDPDNDFLPATGKIERWSAPSSINGLRIDDGVEEGSEVGIYYDPLLAKLIAHGADREEALRKLVYGLRRLSVQGVRTNRDFLIRLLEHEDFRAGESHTEFIAERLDQLTGQSDSKNARVAAVAAAIYLQKSRQSANEILSRIPANYRNSPYRDPSVKLRIGTEVFEVSYRQVEDETYEVACGDLQSQVRVLSFDAGSIRLSIDGLQRLFEVSEAGERLFVHSTMGSCEAVRVPRYPYALAALDEESASAQMPGQVLKILVSEGQEVSAGDALVVLEAMKMEQTVKASTDGIVEKIMVKEGDVVGPGEILIHIAAR
ncbi:MAG: acetyl/propionyl/methylcrotonyl-CoA carboxylase subunit alpha [Blastocatellia bacterium]|nr:acetyl/propionyl/methylcrotonyl-CoA carboxylase subunit alpha [Blastocatellia bacterium]